MEKGKAEQGGLTFLCAKTSTKNQELKKLMESRMVQVEMSEAEVLIIHALATMSDGRNGLTKIFRRRITPVALKILENRKEYHEEVQT